jgi:acid phosphatase
MQKIIRTGAIWTCSALSLCAQPAPRNHEQLNATAWAQTAVEHDAICLQAYRQARLQLDRALKDRKWTAALEQTGQFGRLPPAVILDVDETVLDNSHGQVRAIHKDVDWSPALWDEWVAEEAAPPLPGAVEFTQYAHSRGVTVFFVTNRDKKHEEATRRNLEKHGFPVRAAKGPATDTLLCRGEKPEWVSDKGTRRAEVARNYRVLLLIGDDLGDQMSNVRTTLEERRKLAAKYSDYWGTRWIALPNAMYGSWEASTFGNDFKLTRQQRLDARLKALKTKAGE